MLQQYCLHCKTQIGYTKVLIKINDESGKIHTCELLEDQTSYLLQKDLLKIYIKSNIKEYSKFIWHHVHLTLFDIMTSAPCAYTIVIYSAFNIMLLILMVFFKSFEKKIYCCIRPDHETSAFQKLAKKYKQIYEYI